MTEQFMKLNEYDKFVRRFVKKYVKNLTKDQMRNHLTEQFHIDIENIRQDTGINSALKEMENWEQNLYFDCWEKTFELKENENS